LGKKKNTKKILRWVQSFGERIFPQVQFYFFLNPFNRRASEGFRLFHWSISTKGGPQGAAAHGGGGGGLPAGQEATVKTDDRQQMWNGWRWAASSRVYAKPNPPRAQPGGWHGEGTASAFPKRYGQAVV